MISFTAKLRMYYHCSCCLRYMLDRLTVCSPLKTYHIFLFFQYLFFHQWKMVWYLILILSSFYVLFHLFSSLRGSQFCPLKSYPNFNFSTVWVTQSYVKASFNSKLLCSGPVIHFLLLCSILLFCHVYLPVRLC